MTWEADDVLSVTLVRPDRGPMPRWTLGAHIDLVMPGDIIRQYSLCSRPDELNHWRIAVLREPLSTGGSRYIHEELRPGMTVDVVGPRNNFPLVDAEHYLVIAGGIGVTPLLPMVQELAERRADWRLLYGGRRRASMAFLEPLASLGERVSFVPEDEFGLLDLKTAIEAMPPAAAIYCCGPERLISAVEEQCAERGRAEPHVERFNARPGHLAELEADNAENAPFDVVLANSGRRFTVPADKTIVQVLKENKVFVMVSCTEGYCGVCQTEVISGIPDHRDDYLSDDKRAANDVMMICCGRAKSAELVLRL